LGGLGTTYDVHLGLIGKRAVDFLLVLIELISLGVMAEATWAKIDRKSEFWKWMGQYVPNFPTEGDVPYQSFLHWQLAQWMPYNCVADNFHTKKLCIRLSSSEVRFYTENGRFAFSSPPLGGLRATYDDHLRLIGKRIVDFPLVLT